MIKSTKNLVFIIITLIAFAFLFIYIVNSYVIKQGSKLEYRDMAAIVSAIIICGTLIVNAINTQINAESSERKISIDIQKLEFDKQNLLTIKKFYPILWLMDTIALT